MITCEDWYIDGGKSLEGKPGIRMFWTCWLVAEGEARNTRFLASRFLCKDYSLQIFVTVSTQQSEEGNHAGVVRLLWGERRVRWNDMDPLQSLQVERLIGREAAR
jgi:hypothetical protein